MTDETPPRDAEHDALSAFLAASTGEPSEADRAIHELLAALRATPPAGDVVGRDEALAAFAAFHDRRDRDRGRMLPLLPVVPVGGDGATTSSRLHSVRRWAAGPTAVVVAAGAVLTSGGLTAAAYTGDLPEPVQGYAHRLVGAPAPAAPHDPAPRGPLVAVPAPAVPTDPRTPVRPAPVSLRRPAVPGPLDAAALPAVLAPPAPVPAVATPSPAPAPTGGGTDPAGSGSAPPPTPPTAAPPTRPGHPTPHEHPEARRDRRTSTEHGHAEHGHAGRPEKTSDGSSHSREDHASRSGTGRTRGAAPDRPAGPHPTHPSRHR